MTRQLLTFSRKQVIQLKVLDLNAVLGNLANMLPRLLGEHILLETSYSKLIPSIEADTGRHPSAYASRIRGSTNAYARSTTTLIST